jgi:hypothetical protein
MTRSTRSRSETLSAGAGKEAGAEAEGAALATALDPSFREQVHPASAAATTEHSAPRSSKLESTVIPR